MGKRDKRVAFMNPIAMARARGPAPNRGPTIRDYLSRNRPTLEEAEQILASTQKKVSDTLTALEEEQNDRFREVLRKQREELLGKSKKKKRKKKRMDRSGNPRKERKRKRKHSSSSSDDNSHSDSEDQPGGRGPELGEGEGDQPRGSGLEGEGLEQTPLTSLIPPLTGTRPPLLPTPSFPPTSTRRPPLLPTPPIASQTPHPTIPAHTPHPHLCLHSLGEHEQAPDVVIDTSTLECN